MLISRKAIGAQPQSPVLPYRARSSREPAGCQSLGELYGSGPSAEIKEPLGDALPAMQSPDTAAPT
ncbi:hypothetical protein IAQ61_010174, partial [Plenodomus lingam]|uniref:Predicted protein n=1 Tax=Leptosphaeria maculans (strain JN3 / isolate v23.1.3 / race Av1-4-5-6-7-8) TaxID=985895 RepID=E5A358_LEPMJ